MTRSPWVVPIVHEDVAVALPCQVRGWLRAMRGIGDRRELAIGEHRVHELAPHAQAIGDGVQQVIATGDRDAIG